MVGAGTFATVYRGWDEALDVAVAIKVLAQNWSFDPETRARFIAEAQILRRAHGAKVVRVHDIGETDDGCPFFVMDFAEHGTVEGRLGDLATSGRGLLVEDVSRFARCLAEAVAEVHGLGVCHRDLKPSNLLLRVDPRSRASGGFPEDPVGTALVHADELLVVGDLGLARGLDGPTRLTSVVGTPGYMAPEQADAGSRVDERADIYACTALLHTVVTGRPPEAGSPADTDPAQVPPAVATLLLRGLAPDPADRFADTDEWLATVEEALDTSGEGWGGSAPTIAFVSTLSSLDRGTPRPSRRSAPVPGRSTNVVTSPGRRRRGRGRRPRSGLAVALAAAGATAVVAALVVAVVAARDPREAPQDLGAQTAGSEPAAEGPASAAALLESVDVAVAPDGTTYFTESAANRVRAVSPDGSIRTVAGTGRPGFSGDGGPAVKAQLQGPIGLALGDDGSVFVADSLNARVRRIGPDGRITTVAGSGSTGAVTAGMDARAAPIAPFDVGVLHDGSLAVTDPGNHRVWRVVDGKLAAFAGNGESGSGGDGTAAVDATLTFPLTVATRPGGAVLVADMYAGSVREVRPDGSIGTVASGLQIPTGVAATPLDDVVVTAATGHVVLRVDAHARVTILAGNGQPGDSGDGGPATDATFSFPAGVAVGPDSSVIVADAYANRVRRIGADGNVVLVAGGGPAGNAGDNGPAAGAALRGPGGMAFDGDGNLYVSEAYAGRVRRIDTDGTITTVVGQSLMGGGSRLNEAVSLPAGLAAGPDSTIYLAEYGGDRILAVPPAGGARVVAGTGVAGLSGDGGPGSVAQIDTPAGVWLDPDAALVFTDAGNNRVRRVGPDGTVDAVAGGPGLVDDGRPAQAGSVVLASPVGVVRAGDGTLFVAESDANRVRRIGTDGWSVVVAGTGEAGFSGDGGPAIAARLNGPQGIALASDGTLFVAESDGNRVRRIGPDGTITTVAGTGEAGFSGDGGPADAAELSGPENCIVGPDGALYVADTGNNRIRRIGTDATVATVAGAF